MLKVNWVVSIVEIFKVFFILDFFVVSVLLFFVIFLLSSKLFMSKSDMNRLFRGSDF